MNRVLKELLLLGIGTVFGVVIHGSITAWTYEEPEPIVITEYQVIEAEPEIRTETIYIPYVPENHLDLSVEECALLEQIAFAEARGEGTMGMALVMNVVVNRSEKTGKSIKEVIYSPGQFYTEGMTPNVSEDCHKALDLVIDGLDESQGALFFNKYGYRNGKEALFQYGAHYFSK